MHKHPLKLKAALWLIASLTMLSGAVIAASLPGISAHFVSATDEQSEFLSRLILTIPALTIAITAPIAGLVIHKFGRLKPLFIGLVLYAVTGSSGLFADTIWTILLGRIGLGLSVAIVMTVGVTLTGDYFTNVAERNRFMSLQGTFVTLAGVFFLSGGGFLSDLSWRAPFGVYLVSLLLIPLAVAGLYEPKLHIEATKKEAGLFGEGGYFTVFPVFCAAFATMAIFYIVPTQLPFLIMNKLHGSGAETGIVMGIGPLFAAFAAYNYEKFYQRYNLKTIFVIIFMAQGLGLAVVGFADFVWQLYAPFILVGLGNGLAMANTQVWFLQLAAPAKRAKLSGILTGSFFLGQFFSPFFVHPFLEFMELSRVFTIFGLFLVIAAFALFAWRFRSDRGNLGDRKGN
ncbi:MFS transporter [Campylobacterota bacterium]|nr:MFS transporter [Campylobacterota bacterium]